MLCFDYLWQKSFSSIPTALPERWRSAHVTVKHTVRQVYPISAAVYVSNVMEYKKL